MSDNELPTFPNIQSKREKELGYQPILDEDLIGGEIEPIERKSDDSFLEEFDGN
jgi:hypothetical protein